MVSADAIKKIEELVLASQEERTIGGRTFLSGKPHIISPPMHETTKVFSLSSLADYARELGKGYFVHVESESRVSLRSVSVNGELDRDVFAVADVTGLVNNFEFGEYHKQTQFLIDLVSCFVVDDGLTKVIQIASKIKLSEEGDFNDDGITQTVNVKKGAAMMERVDLPNPVELKCYRSFPEVEPVAQKFVFRLKEGRSGGPEFALFESKSRLWELNTIREVKKLMREALPDVVVI